MVQSVESFLRKDPTRSSGTNPAVRCPLLKSEVRAVFMMIGSIESRAAARVLSNTREEAEAISVHIEIVGFGDSPSCECKPCRDRRSQATPEKQAAVLAEFESFMATACPNSPLRHSNAGRMR